MLAIERDEMDLPETRDARDGTTNRLLSWLRAADRWARGCAGSRRARGLLLLFLITMTLAMLGWSVYRDWDALAAFEWQFDLRYVGLAFLGYTVALFLVVLTWHGIMGSLAGFTNLRLNVKFYLYSAAARRLPGFVWYVGSLLYLYRQEGVPKTRTSVALLLESVLIALSGLLVFLGSMPFSQVDLLAGGSPWFFLGTVPLLVVAFQPSLLIRLLNAILPRMGRAPLDLQIRRRDSVRWMMQYAIASIASGLVLYCLAWAVHPLPASALPGVVGVVALTPLLRLIAFFIPAGWGIQEVSLSLSLSPYLPLPIALGIPLLFRLCFAVGELAWLLACSLFL
jgi:hypothetical protein